MGDAILTALVIGVSMWVFLFVVYLILGLIMTAVRNVGKDQKKFFNIAMYRYDRPSLLEFDSFGQMLKGGLRMCSEITVLGFAIILIVCVVAALT